MTRKTGKCFRITNLQMLCGPERTLSRRLRSSAASSFCDLSALRVEIARMGLRAAFFPTGYFSFSGR